MAEAVPEYDFLAKIILTGEARVGKTSMFHKYSDPHYCCDPNNCTIAVDFKMKTIDVDGKKAKLQIWDTAGQEKYGSLTQTYFRGSNGVLLCYAINNRESFEKIEYWMERVKKGANNKNVCLVLVGTKSDLSDERAVGFDEGKQMAESLGAKFFETSAKNRLNLDEMFLELARDISEVIDKKKSDKKSVTKIKSGENNSTGASCFKCS